MKKETYYVANEEEYDVTNEEEYEEAVKEAKADCANALHFLCDMWKGGEIDDYDIYYKDEEDTTINGESARIIASVEIDADDDYDRYNALLRGFRAIFDFDETNHIEVSLKNCNIPLAVIDIDEEMEEIVIYCLSNPIINVSED